MIFELFSRREERSEGNAAPDLYQYDVVPAPLRVQVQQILSDAIGPYYIPTAYGRNRDRHNPDAWEFAAKVLRRELGVHALAHGDTAAVEVLNFIGGASVSNFIDAIEVCVSLIDEVITSWTDYQRKDKGIEQEPKEAIEELNYRFRQSGLGFQFADGRAFRMDSDFIHEEVVRPALRLLARPAYGGAQEEFLAAHRHYRNGDYEEAISGAAKAFESTLKITCDTQGWQYQKGARASDLLKVVRAAGLWPEHFDASFDQLLATLASGLPKIRNEQSAHGQGGQRRSTPSYIAAYALNLAASKIIFVSEAASAFRS